MSLYSLKMRASKHTMTGNEHVSGAEKILYQEELPDNMTALLQRALHHAKGRADFINLKIESIQPQEIETIDALSVSSVAVETPAQGQQAILTYLAQLGISNGPDIMEQFQDTYAMRGAMLLNVDTLERMEPDPARGIRATYMDGAHTHPRPVSEDKNHFQEAIILASKVVHAPHILAEICMSDDPDYVTGYVAAKSIGYVRITKLKEMGCPDGGRIFLFRGSRKDAAETIRYLEHQRVIVRHAAATPDGQPVSPAARPDPYARLTAALYTRREQHLYRTLTELSSAQCAHVTCAGRDMLMLASNNYLGLANHPALKQAAQQAIDTYGCSSGGSRLTTGTLPLHTQLESALARFKGTEAALLFNTGYCANVGILSALSSKETIIFSDELNHASIIDGCRLSRARTIVYRHNDMQDLEQKIQAAAPAHGLIVSDAVFSMDGDIADLPGIVELGQRYGLLTMLDEAHATGVIGRTGRGICECFPSCRKPDLLMGTLSKALGSEGGYVAASQLIIDYLRNTARSFIFSTSQTPATLAAALTALNLLQADSSHVAHLQENTRCFCEALQSQGIPVQSETAIVPIPIGDEASATAVAETLFRQGIFINAIRYPTVAKGSARLRAAIMATHTPEELRTAAQTIAAVLRNRGRFSAHIK